MTISPAFLRSARIGVLPDSNGASSNGALRDAPGEATTGSQAGERNRLLRAFDPAGYAMLMDLAETTDFQVGHTLWQPNSPIRSVYFPTTCVGSILTVLERDAPVEAATVGAEGMVGVPIVLGVTSSPALAVVQIRGEAYRIDAERFRRVLHESPTVAAVCLRYAQALQDQTAQTVACNRRHEMGERCARWLLMTADRAGANQFNLTHEFLASMLGVRRASVTVAAGVLQQAGLIRYSRGKITLLDRDRLEEASCECYRLVRNRYERTVGLPGF